MQDSSDFDLPSSVQNYLLRNMHLFYQPLLSEGVFHLDTEESRHAIKVLRLKKEDEITLIDGKGFFYQARITVPDLRKCVFEVVASKKEKKTSGFRHLAIAPTKSIDRIEWFVEKAVEIGIDRISFIYSENSERKVIKTDRIVRKAVSAMKQSIKARLPEIDEIKPLKTFLTENHRCNKFLAHVDFDNPRHLKEVIEIDNLILIGPEGDFTSHEVQMALDAGFVKVSLGESRLRTETAGIIATHILNL